MGSQRPALTGRSIFLDFLIKNGTVYDPALGRMEQRDLALADGKIARPDPGRTYRQIVDAKGCIVTTGLIDYHVHYFYRGTENGVNPDANAFCSGITTAVDGGSCGAGSYELYRRSVMAMSDVRILNYLLVASGGQATDQYPENLDPALFDEQKILRLFREYPDNLVALKTRMSQGIVPAGQAEASLRRTVELAEKAGTRVVVHVTAPILPLDQIAEMLRPGDVICHIYQNRGQYSCLGQDGQVLEGLWAARERGVLFDASNGRSNYDLEVCRRAVSQGFAPDVISSDVNTSSYFLQPLHSLPRILSKYLDFGMGLGQVLDAATITPARLIGRPELGSLAEGTEADVCILRLKQKAVPYEDINQNRFEGSQVLVPMMTFKGGKCMFCQADFC